MRIILRVIDSLSEVTGNAARWICPALVLVLCFEVTARYAFDSPTAWATETASMLGATIAVVGWAYTLKHDGHVRVDVWYSRMSTRGKALVNIVGSIILLFPMCFILTYIAADRTVHAWTMGEVLIESSWYPPAGPLRTVMFLGLSLFTLQGVVQFVHDCQVLRKNHHD